MEFVSCEGIEVVPGTVHLVDCKLPSSFGTGLLGSSFCEFPQLTMLFTVQGMMNLRKNPNQPDIVLIPQPSDDPDDPLNWSRLRKEYHFWLLVVWGTLAAASLNWSGPVWVRRSTRTKQAISR
jgi:hypothetical protein